jgi:hypothetical protein
MMWTSVYVAVLFFLLAPGVLVTLPPGGSRMTVLLTHAVVAGLVWALTHRAVMRIVSHM